MNKIQDYLTRSDVDRMVKIIGTEHNMNAMYTDQSKEVWKLMYSEGVEVKDIASVWNADPRTVKMVVDPVYREKVKGWRVKANRNYHERHGHTPQESDYRRKLIDRKIKILEGDRYIKPAISAK